MADKNLCNNTEIKKFFQNYGKILKKSEGLHEQVMDHLEQEFEDTASDFIYLYFDRFSGKGVYEPEPNSEGVLSTLSNPEDESEVMTREYGSSDVPPEGNVRKYFSHLERRKWKPLKFIDIDMT